jgi:hypothetical protein
VDRRHPAGEPRGQRQRDVRHFFFQRSAIPSVGAI